MMAVLMARLCVEAGSVIVAAVVAPIQYFTVGGSKAVAVVAICYMVGRMAALTKEEFDQFNAFIKKGV